MSGFTNKKTKLIFTASLICNVLLVGMIGGHVYRGMQDQPWHELKEGLSPETRDLLRTTFQEKRERIFGLMRQFDEKKKVLEQVFTASEFDAQAFETAAQDFIVFNQELSKGKLQTFKDLGAKLPQEDRQLLARKFVGALAGAPPDKSRHGMRAFGKEHKGNEHEHGSDDQQPTKPDQDQESESPPVQE